MTSKSPGLTLLDAHNYVGQQKSYQLLCIENMLISLFIRCNFLLGLSGFSCNHVLNLYTEVWDWLPDTIVTKGTNAGQGETEDLFIQKYC